MKNGITREQARDMAAAHAEGLHAEIPREGCPECEGRELREYPSPCSTCGGKGYIETKVWANARYFTTEPAATRVKCPDCQKEENK